MRVLFILQSIGYGGSMTSLINLLSFLRDDKEIQYEVLFMDPYGALLEEAKQTASVCKKNFILEATSMSRSDMRNRKLYGHLLVRGFMALYGKIRHISVVDIGYALAARRYDNCYDCVIAFQESIATNFAIHIKANRHVAWVHNDYHNVEHIYGNQSHLRKLYSRFDKIVCVSRAGAENFKRYSGLDQNKITYIYNTLPTQKLIAKASIPFKTILSENNREEIISALQSTCIKLVSSGRFAKQKRFDRVIDAACLLKKEGYQFKWFILGNGELFESIKASIISNNLENEVLLTGGLRNPFPLVKACDFFVLSSDFEAHPMVANEALILGTPVITTNYESAYEVIKNNETGLICEMRAESIAEAVKSLLDNVELRRRIQKNVNAFVYSNKVILQQVRDIIINKKEET